MFGQTLDQSRTGASGAGLDRFVGLDAGIEFVDGVMLAADFTCRGCIAGFLDAASQGLMCRGPALFLGSSVVATFAVQLLGDHAALSLARLLGGAQPFGGTQREGTHPKKTNCETDALHDFFSNKCGSPPLEKRIGNRSYRLSGLHPASQFSMDLSHDTRQGFLMASSHAGDTLVHARGTFSSGERGFG